MSWQDDPSGLLHRLFWNESLADPEEGVYRAMGAVHLYSSSGIHLYAFLQSVDRGLAWVSRRSGLDLRVCKRAGWTLAFSLILAAWSLQSFRPGFARPILTFLIRKWGHQGGVRFRVLAPLLATLLVDVCFHFGGGRAHYYLAVAGGLLALERLEQSANSPPGVWKSHLALALGSWLLSAPLDLLEHHRISWLTPVLSLLSLPAISLGLYPASLTCLFVDGVIPPPLLHSWDALLESMIRVADVFPGPLTVPGAAVWVGGALAIGWLSRPNLRGLMLLLGCLLRVWIPLPSGLTQLNVQQGDGLLIQTGPRTEMMDVGPDRGLRSGDWVDELQRHRVEHIDAILLTHLDADHVSGLTHLLPWVQVDCIETHERHWESEKGKRLRRFLERVYPAVALTDHGCFRSGAVGWFGSTTDKSSGNEMMAGVVIPLSRDEVYLALGDGDQSQEAQYWERFGGTIESYPHRLWKLGHHGSRFSSSPRFLEALRPERIWISVGRRNPYHHPHPETLQRLRALSFHPLVQRTDEEGDLTANTSQPSWFRMREN